VTTVVENVGEAIRTEIQEAVDEVDIAASYDLEDVEGIGPTYADRLRSAGIESVSALAVSEETNVAEVARASTRLARTWIARAQTLVSADDGVESER
jgi:polyhydroxyalkanoate synthase